MRFSRPRREMRQNPNSLSDSGRGKRRIRQGRVSARHIADASKFAARLWANGIIHAA